MDKEEIKKYAEESGWEEILPNKNIYMISFNKRDIRLNVYFTKGTVTLQSKNKEYDSGKIYKECSLNKLRKIFLGLSV